MNIDKYMYNDNLTSFLLSKKINASCIESAIFVQV